MLVEMATITDANGISCRVMLCPVKESADAVYARCFQYIDEMEERYSFLYDAMYLMAEECPGSPGHAVVHDAMTLIGAGGGLPPFEALPKDIQVAMWNFLDENFISHEELVRVAVQVIARPSDEQQVMAQRQTYQAVQRWCCPCVADSAFDL